MNDKIINEFMLTTLDNPYNPFTNFDAWYNFDIEKGYNTCSYLARIVSDSYDLSEEDRAAAVNDGINEITLLNLLGIYTKVTKENFDTVIKNK